MLIAVTVMPIIFGMLTQVPPDAPAAAAPVSAFVTLALVVGIVMRGRGFLRLWAPVVGVAGGCIVAGFFGL
jgi:xanthine/uracil permease